MADFTLQLLHAADQEAGLPAVEDAPRFSGVLNALRNEDLDGDGIPGFDNTVTLSSGDAYIPGLFFGASENVFGADGRGDILIQNALGFEAIALGNHEFDFGVGTVADLLLPSEDGTFPGTDFPYLSSNLDFSTDATLAPLVAADGQEASTIPNSIAGNTIITLPDGERIGVVGATTPSLPEISSPGDVTVLPLEFDESNPDDIAALADEIQLSVDDLLADNTDIDKVILLSHMQQITIEEQLAEFLTDVDIIVAGGSNTRLFDENDRIRAGDTDQGIYPIIQTDADGNPVAVVNTDGSYKYVGRLVIDFDENGVIIPESYDPAVSGAFATDEQGVIDLNAAQFIDPEVQAVADAIGEEIVRQESNFFGITDVFLNGNRSGGGVDGVRNQETNLGNLTADANLAIAQETDPSTVISLKNGGGIRANIGDIIVPPGGTDPERLPPEEVPGVRPEGGISETSIINTLAFNNGLTLVTTTAEELLAILEHGVSDSTNEVDSAQGRFPQVSGLAFSFDLEQPNGERVESVAIKDASGETIDVVVENGEVVGDPARTFRLVTLSFIADGGDGFPIPQTDRIDLAQSDEAPRTGDAMFAPDGSEQDALAEYLEDNFLNTPFDQEDVPREEDQRIQNLFFREDTVIGDVSGGDFTLISEIQGEGAESPLVGQTVTIEGIVTGDFQTLNGAGLFVQEEDADSDGNPLTSEGISMFAPPFVGDASVGDKVQVTGTVEEFFGKTQLADVEVTVVEGGSLDQVTPVEVALPVEDFDNLEAFEGMLVTFPQTLAVTDTFNLGRFGEVLLSGEEPLRIPTNSIDPNDDPASGTSFEGDSNVEAVTAQQELNNLNQITLDDGSSADAEDLEDPVFGVPVGTSLVPYVNREEGEATTLRRGSTVEDLTGVLDFSFGRYRVQRNPYEETDLLNTEFPIEFDYAERPEVPEVGGDVTAASFNVLNYFTTIDDGVNTTNGLSPRGADSEAEFERQQAKIVSAITELDADIVGLIEIENNGDVAISNLVDALNEVAGEGTYDFISDPVNFNEVPGSTDAIKVGLIYQPDAVTPVGEAQTTSSEAFEFPPGGRAPVAQTFEADGEQFTVMVNHFKSKGGTGEGADADQGDGQGNFNATRKAQAQAVADFVEELQVSTGDEDVLVIGDLNSYTEEDPIDLLRDAGLVDEISRFATEEPSSFVFFGQEGSLDFILSTPGLSAQVSGAAEWEINADEPRTLDYNDAIFDREEDRFEDINPDGTLFQPDPFRSSDHDPLVVGLSFADDAIEGTDDADELVGSDAAETILAKAGNDTVAGGLGADNIDGGDGDDILRGDLNERFSGVEGDDDTITGGAGNDRIGGKAGDDVLFGEDGDDRIWGDDGDDILRGGPGNDRLFGDATSVGSGSDTFILAIGEGTDRIIDFEVGIDLIGLADGLSFDQLSLSQGGRNTLVEAAGETLAIVRGVAPDALTEDSFTIV